MTDGIFILSGSNLGDQVAQLDRARKLLVHRGITLTACSSIYRSAAWGPVEQPDFANQVWMIRPATGPNDLLSLLLEVEAEMGRERMEKWGPRIIDLDLLYYNQVILKSDRLQVPHPEIQHRRFTLVPMAEIAPEFLHPGLKKTQASLLRQCPDKLRVEPWS